MHRVLLLGAGKIGRMIARLLVEAGDYDVLVGDAEAEAVARLPTQPKLQARVLNAGDAAELAAAMEGRHTVLSALSYRFNPLVAEVAARCGLSYFDLTEDIATTREVRQFAATARPGQIFMPQCGLAPGFVSICAHHLAQQFERLDTVHLRVGALPQFPTNILKYNLTWSTDGLINEYCNVCDSIVEGQRRDVLPLEGYEHFSLDGVRYEAFNTSGGLGTLCESLSGQVRELNYKTVRYLGHRDLAYFLLQELRLAEQRDRLKEILEYAIPITFQDVVIVFCSVTGWRKGQLVQLNDARKIYRQELPGETWSAIQRTTAAGICAALDLHVAGRLPRQGFVRQEDIALPEFLQNRFGKVYDTDSGSRYTNASAQPQEAAHVRPE